MDYVGFAYAALVFVGGVVGYAKAGSVVSLASGVIMGSLMAMAAKLTSNDSDDAVLAFGVSLTLLLVMGYRFYATGKFMPAGLVSLLSLAMAIRYGARVL
ncbi:Transmembrane protein 14C [Dimargaris verticillata]|uniref:Transmembrane protein 14C n=1 Tax=Dimargaris verticillata TaxID=2761393 RepID=A0A9W8EA27_9FUNG|nr:Transmembrane protein 14C [Dimargaris verticillata]